MHIKKILVPIDLSDYSFEAVQYACELAAGREAQMYLLHVIPVEPALAYCAVDQHSETAMRDLEQASIKKLDGFISKKICDEKRIAQVIRRGDPSGEIINFARDEHFDLIVMASHGRTGLKRVLMGSVAEKIVRRSSVPVLIVKPQDILIDQKDVDEQLEKTTNQSCKYSTAI